MKNDNNLQLAIDQTQISLSVFKKVKIPEKINSDLDYKLASDAVKYLNDKVKYAEEVKNKYTRPLWDEKKRIDGEFKRLESPLEILIEKAKEKMLDYMKKKQIEQKEYEEKMMKDNKENDLLVVDDKIDAIKHATVSGNYLKTTIKYRTADPMLQSAVVIKPEEFKNYLKNGGKMPAWIEEYTEENIVVRSKN
jgi:hypothetical protein